jgi:uncharacterized membrane protein YfcA
MISFQSLVAEFGITTLVVIAFAAIVTSCIHGAVGVAGGFLMTAALALLIGVRPSVPIMSIALVLSHGARSVMNLTDLNWKAFAAVMVPAVPFILLSSYVYVELPVNVLAWVLAAIMFTSIPLRHWARSREIRAGGKTLAAAGMGYGFLAGASIGSAMLLSPFMLGYGLAKESFVATMAIISLTTNMTRITVFGSSDVLTSEYALLGVAVGLLMIPGNWAGRTVLRRMTTNTHGRLVDFFAVIGGLNFVYLAIAG